ncbi:MAG: hypothetical protein J6I47_10080 [Ruminococcus sp.]|nr:hypothetical protein [Ruminococcus sp.]
MLSPSERKKSSNFAKTLLPSFGAEMKKYEEVYADYSSGGYTKELCEHYADVFINDVKKPQAEDIVQVASLYDRIHDSKSAGFYLDMLMERKLSGDDKFGFCIEVLKAKSKLGHWRDAEDFRTENISFLQNYVQKHSDKKLAEMYMTLSLVDCAAKRYNDAFKLLRFGYKPHGRNDVTLLEMLITGVYIFANSGERDGLEEAVANTHSCLKLFSEFEFSWSKEYYEKRIEEAAQGIL